MRSAASSPSRQSAAWETKDEIRWLRNIGATLALSKGQSRLEQQIDLLTHYLETADGRAVWYEPARGVYMDREHIMHRAAIMLSALRRKQDRLHQVI